MIVPEPGTAASRLVVAVTWMRPEPLTTACTSRAVSWLSLAWPSPLIVTSSRSGQQSLNRCLQVGQRLAIEPGAVGDPCHAQLTEPGQVRASGPGVAIDRPGHFGDQGSDVPLVAHTDRVDAVSPRPQVEAAPAHRLRDPLLPSHPRPWQEGVGARVDDDRDPSVACGGPDGRQPL